MAESDSPIRFRPASRKEPEGDEAIGFVWWNEITQDDVDAFAATLDAAGSEHDLQRYLGDHPLLLIQPFSGGHGRWVHPRKRLGSEHVTDFVIGDRDSLGYDWLAVELESPLARPFTAAGDPSAHLTHAFRQLHDWRNWLTSNIDYARRPQSEHGLGLIGIEPDTPGLILIGRDEHLSDSTRELRRRMAKENNTQIRTFDWLGRKAQGRVDELARFWSRRRNDPG
jgi:hypothetical protein